MIREEILRESHGYDSPYIKEDYALSSFVRGFVEDTKYFGEHTADLYKCMFLLEDESYVLKENFELVEKLAKEDNVFLFEGVINEKSLGSYIDGEFGKGGIKGADRAAGEQAMRDWAARPKPPAGFIPGQGKPLPPMDPTKAVSTSLGAQMSDAQVKELLQRAADAPSSAEAVKILTHAAPSSAASASLAAGAAGAAKGAAAAASSAAPAAAQAAGAVKGAAAAAVKSKPGLLGFIGKAFSKVKDFFSGGITSIGSAIKAGNWGAIMKIPLVQGALGVGGAALAFALIKKIFGKKIKEGQEASLKAALEAKGAKK